MADNGGGGTGGNTSVVWEVRHGKKTNPEPPAQHSGSGPPPRGYYKVQQVVEGHSNADFDAIGRPDHAGLFKVILRFRDADLGKVSTTQKAWIDEQAGKPTGRDRFLTLYVPALPREMPGANGKWGDMPWEIQWEW